MVEELKKKFKELQESFNSLFSIKPKDGVTETGIIKKQEPFFEKLTKFSENLAVGFENMQQKFSDDLIQMKNKFQNFQEEWNRKVKEIEQSQQEKKEEWKKQFDEWNKQNQKNFKEGLDFWNKAGWKLYVQLLVGTIPIILILILVTYLIVPLFR